MEKIRLDKIVHRHPNFYMKKLEIITKIKRNIYKIVGIEKKRSEQLKSFCKFRDENLFKFASNTSILDIGCGIGDKLNEICSKYNSKGIGIDISKEMIKSAKRNYPQYKFIKCSAEKIPLPSKSVDLVLFYAVFHHINKKNQKKVLKEAERISKSKIIIFDSLNFNSKIGHFFGTIYWKTIDGGYQYYNKKEWLEFFKDMKLIDYFLDGGLLMRHCMFVIDTSSQNTNNQKVK